MGCRRVLAVTLPLLTGDPQVPESHKIAPRFSRFIEQVNVAFVRLLL